MGQKSSKERLHRIQVNVTEISNVVRTSKLSSRDRERYEDLLHDYSQELKYILSKSIKPSKLIRVQRLIQVALQELDTVNARATLRRIDSDINYLSRLQAKEKSLHDLDKLGKSLETLNRELNLNNFRAGKEVFDELKTRVDSIEEITEEVRERKSEVFTIVSGVENAFLELEMEDKLRQAEEKHYKNKLDLRRFMGVFDSKSYKNHKQFLLQLRDEVNRILEVTEKVAHKKKYVLFNINNNIVAIDQKAKENEDRIKNQIVSHSLTDNQSSINVFIDSYRKFEEGFLTKGDLSKLREIFGQLNEVKLKIDQQLKVLEVQMDDGYCVVKKIEPLGENQVPNKMEIVQKEVETLQKQVEKTTCTKDSQEYKIIVKKLEECKAKMKNFGNGKFQDNILKYINDVSILLEDKTTKASGDILIDIISVSTNVNELGEKIQRNDFYDLNSMQKSLEEHLEYLRNLKISPARNNICKFRDYVVIQIQSHLSNLEKIKINESIANNKDKQFLI